MPLQLSHGDSRKVVDEVEGAKPATWDVDDAVPIGQVHPFLSA